MKPLIMPKGLSRIVMLVLVGGGLVLFTKYFGPAARQADNLALARAYANRLEPQVHSDTRFTDIRLGANTGHGGCLWVFGSVTSEQDSNDLHRLIEASHPPVSTRYDLRLVSPEPGSANRQ